MHRRIFTRKAASLAGAVALAGTGLPLRVRAQGDAPVDGQDYLTLARPISVPADGRIQVIEFFWYGCPHCYAFEPLLETWLSIQRADVEFRRVPVGFDRLRQVHQRIFYTWEAMGLVQALHVKTFQRFHVERKPIGSEADMLNFANELGLDVPRVKSVWSSFGVASKCAQAQRLEDEYDIQRTPQLAIQGRFTTFARADSVPARALAVTDWLIDRVRRSG
jgi:thiol:disulfide interchange protein DsbA